MHDSVKKGLLAGRLRKLQVKLSPLADDEDVDLDVQAIDEAISALSGVEESPGGREVLWHASQR